MRDLFWLTDEQMGRLEPFFPRSRGRPRVDDRRVLSGIIFVNRNGLRWRDAPDEYGPPKTLYNRWKPLERHGGLRTHDGGTGRRSGDAQDCHDRRHLPQGAPHGVQPAVEKGGPGTQKGRLIGRTKGGLNTKLHAVTDGDGRPIRFFLSAGQVSDYTGALALLDTLPKAEWLIADRGYDADWFREALTDNGIRPCIPGRKSRDRPIKHDKRRYKRRHRIEMMFGRLKDWRRVATRYDRCPIVFLSAIALSPAPAVPLPASAWTLLAALGGIGAVAPRKQRLAA